MRSVHLIILLGSGASVVLWAALAAYVVGVQRQRARARGLLASAIAALRADDVRRLPVGERIARVRGQLDAASRDSVLHAAADPETPPEAFDTLAAYLADRWTIDLLVRDAASHRTRREKWRRGAVLRILFHAGDPRSLELLAGAVEGRDPDVAAIALSLLGNSQDPNAIPILIDALKRRLHPASRVAVHLDRSPQLIADALRPLVLDADPVVRFWVATLLGRYVEDSRIEADLLPLTRDTDPRVRKAAIHSLGRVGDGEAAAAALRLLGDPFAFVRAHAARALGELNRTDLAAEVATLLGDADWWVRLAAKESLEAMGTEVWATLVHCLDHPDRFVRNGAAEVVQNLGILDSLIVMEAATENPSAAKIDLLRRISAAGGAVFTDSLVDRAGPAVGGRVRQLLAAIGLEHVEAC